MKISTYRKDPHLEGYDGKEGSPEKKTTVESVENVQSVDGVNKASEKGNDANTVTSFGNKTLKAKNSRGLNENNILAKDGFDNTGTQGKDSLHDDAYPHKDGMETKESAESNTGSSSKDFK
ncbi:hypothetical protein ABIB40_000752 [Pedobacter sp. UYP30]|uniref:hypothetical protein n=1 Tax=Pedobacter sp. UYP30 TaxID=1756400 RepID=UPI003396BAB6